MQSNNTTTRKGFLALMGGAIGAVAVGAKGAPQKAQREVDVASGSMPSELDRFFEVYHRLLSQLPNGGMRSQDIFWLHRQSCEETQALRLGRNRKVIYNEKSLKTLLHSPT